MILLLVATAALVAGLTLGFVGGRRASRPKPPAGPGMVDLSRYEATFPDPSPVPPWWTAAPGAYELPIAVIRRFAVPADAQRAAGDVERVLHLVQLIGDEGIKTAMCIRIDQCGRAVLEDGHHRIEVSHHLGIASWPVEFKPSDRITGWGQPVALLVAALAELVEAGQPGGHRRQP